MYFPVLRLAVVLGSLVSLCALLILAVRTRQAGMPRLHSAPRSDARKGILHAFTAGSMPWNHTGAARHPVRFLAGTLYHLGIFAYFAYLFDHVLSTGIPFPMIALRIVIAGGLAAGLGLLLQRLLSRHMLAVSCPDDFASNLVVNASLALALAHTFAPAALEEALLNASLVLILYSPVGKIRHCFFFFYSRFIFGSVFGRRGVFKSVAFEEQQQLREGGGR